MDLQPFASAYAMASRSLAVASDLLDQTSRRLEAGDVAVADQYLRAGLDALSMAFEVIPEARDNS